MHIFASNALLITTKNHAEAHANALLEHEFKEGDVLALWFPDGAEKVTIRLLKGVSVPIPELSTFPACHQDRRRQGRLEDRRH